MFSNRQLQRKHNYFQKENLKQHFGDKYLHRNGQKFLCDSDCQLDSIPQMIGEMFMPLQKQQ